MEDEGSDIFESESERENKPVKKEEFVIKPIKKKNAIKKEGIEKKEGVKKKIKKRTQKIGFKLGENTTEVKGFQKKPILREDGIIKGYDDSDEEKYSGERFQSGWIDQFYENQKFLQNDPNYKFIVLVAGFSNSPVESMIVEDEMRNQLRIQQLREFQTSKLNKQRNVNYTNQELDVKEGTLKTEIEKQKQIISKLEKKITRYSLELDESRLYLKYMIDHESNEYELKLLSKNSNKNKSMEESLKNESKENLEKANAHASFYFKLVLKFTDHRDYENKQGVEYIGKILIHDIYFLLFEGEENIFKNIPKIYSSFTTKDIMKIKDKVPQEVLKALTKVFEAIENNLNKEEEIEHTKYKIELQDDLVIYYQCYELYKRKKELESEKNELKEIKKQLQNIKDLKSGTQTFKNVPNYPYEHKPDWALRPENSGFIKLKPIVVASISGAYNTLRTWVPWVSKIDDPEILQRGETASDFAQLVVAVMSRSIQNFPRQYLPLGLRRGSTINEKNMVSRFQNCYYVVKDKKTNSMVIKRKTNEMMMDPELRVQMDLM